MLASIRENLADNRVSDPKLALIRLASAIALRCCVLSIVLGAAGNLPAADQTADARRTSTRSSLIRLPSFLKRDRDSTATAKPAPPDPFLSRAAQLLVQARTFEANKKPAAAMEMARRAESIVNAASQTTGTRWPSSTQSPTQYIAALSQRVHVANQPSASIPDAPPFADDPTFNDAPPFSDVPQPQTQSSPPNTTPPDSTAAGFPVALAAQSALPSNSSPQEQPRSNVPAPAIRAKSTGPANSRLNSDNRAQTSTIELTSASQTEPLSSTSDSKTDEASMLFQQLGKFETWSAIEPTAGKTPEIQTREVAQKNLNETATQPSPPMVIPALIDRPDGIEDQNVAPIPTRPTDSIEGSAPESVTTTIPVVPESIEQTPPIQLPQDGSSSDDRQSLIASQDDHSQTSIYDSTPQLLTQHSAATLAATTSSTDNSASVWQLAAAQLLATFLGVLLAIGLFLVIRAAALQLFGARLGVTFHFGSSNTASAETRSNNQSADTVPFGVRAPHDSTTTADSQPEETRRADGVADTPEFPFRVVGSSKSEHDSSAEGDLNQQQESAILRTVFDQNLDLMSELDKQNGSAA